MQKESVLMSYGHPNDLDSGSQSTVSQPIEIPTIEQDIYFPCREDFETQLKISLEDLDIFLDQELLILDGKEVDLYDLARAVLDNGGFDDVSRLYVIIAADLGFSTPTPPASGSDRPARSTPEIALDLQNIYQKYLLEWEYEYMDTLEQYHSESIIASAATHTPHENLSGASFTTLEDDFVSLSVDECQPRCGRV